jgi:histidinol-phosphatase
MEAVPLRAMAGYDDDLRFAHVLADAADDITSRRFRALDLRVEAKPDLTPVTDADHACEESLRNVLRRATRCSGRVSAGPAPGRGAGSSTRSTRP